MTSTGWLILGGAYLLVGCSASAWLVYVSMEEAPLSERRHWDRNPLRLGALVLISFFVVSLFWPALLLLTVIGQLLNRYLGSKQ